MTTTSTTAVTALLGKAEAMIRDDIGDNGSDAPGSRYGRKLEWWAPAAAAVMVIGSLESGDSLADWMDTAVTAVVNDSDQAADMIIDHGPGHGIDPADYLDSDDLAWHLATCNYTHQGEPWQCPAVAILANDNDTTGALARVIRQLDPDQ